MKKTLLLVVFCLFLLNVKSQSLTVNPNPCDQSSQATLTLTSADTVSLYVSNVLGQTILTIASNSPLAAGVYPYVILISGYPSGIYFVVLKTKSGFQQNVKLIKQGPVAIVELNPTSLLRVYPNPFHDLLNIEFGNPGFNKKNFVIENNSGEIVYRSEITTSKERPDLGFLPAGIYFLRLERSRQVLKIVKE